MICRSTDIKAALRSRQRGFLLNPFRFGSAPEEPADIDSQFTKVSLLLHANGANGSTTFTDSSNRNKTATRGGSAQISTARSYFGGASLLLNGTTDYLRFPKAGLFLVKGVPTTIEAMVYRAVAGGRHCIASTYEWIASTNHVNFLWEIGTDNNMSLQLYQNASTYQILAGPSVGAAAWHYCALLYDGTNIYMRTDDTVVGPLAVTLASFTNFGGNYLNIGMFQGFSSIAGQFNGNIDEFRFTQGYARTLGIPTKEYPNSDGKTYATWNPADKNASITLSNNDLTASNPTSSRAVRATIGKSSGKWYWEIMGDSAYLHIYGVANSAASLSSYAGGNADSWGRGSDGSAAYKYHNNAGVAYGSGYTNQTIGVLLDMDAGTLRFTRAGVDQGEAFTGLTGTIYPMVSGISGTAGGPITANFGASPFVYAVPEGYNAGMYEEV